MSDTAPRHLLMEFVKAHKKAVAAQLNLGRGRRHPYGGGGRGNLRFATKWWNTHFKWQRKLNTAVRRLDPYPGTFETVNELAP